MSPPNSIQFLNDFVLHPLRDYATCGLKRLANGIKIDTKEETPLPLARNQLKNTPMKRKFCAVGLSVVLLAATLNPGMGQGINLVQNGSFESVNGSISVVGWQGSYAFGIPPIHAADGQKDVYLTDLSGNPPSNPLWQNVSTVSGQMYALRFASKAPQFGTSEFIGSQSGGNAIGPWVVNVAINGAQIGSFENDSMTTWQYFTTDIVATSSTTTLAFYTDFSAGWPMLDAVSLIAVPEPKLLPLLGGGLLILRIWTWRKQQPLRK